MVAMARVAVGLLAVQVIAVVLQILSKVILNEGAFIYPILMYRHVVAAFCVFPFALYFERGAVKEFSWEALLWLFLAALFGIPIAMGSFYYGLADTTATYATNFLNLIPIVTFLLSIILRTEKLAIQTKPGKIKSLGVSLCLAGALTVALYNGKAFHLTHHQHLIPKPFQHKTRGTLFLVCSCFSYGLWLVLQVKLFKVFPYKYWSVTLICVVAAAQTGVVGVCIDRKLKDWALAWNLQLFTILYSGILATAATFCLLSWAISQKGPTYASIFNPLCVILITFTEPFFLGSEIYVGSLLGMSLIIVGLYSFLWATNIDTKSTSIPALTHH